MYPTCCQSPVPTGGECTADATPLYATRRALPQVKQRTGMIMGATRSRETGPAEVLKCDLPHLLTWHAAPVTLCMRQAQV
jgi:hypothetical protein